jgi:hypothetical protein
MILGYGPRIIPTFANENSQGIRAFGRLNHVTVKILETVAISKTLLPTAPVMDWMVAEV